MAVNRAAKIIIRLSAKTSLIPHRQPKERSEKLAKDLYPYLQPGHIPLNCTQPLRIEEVSINLTDLSDRGIEKLAFTSKESVDIGTFTKILFIILTAKELPLALLEANIDGLEIYQKNPSSDKYRKVGAKPPQTKKSNPKMNGTQIKLLITSVILAIGAIPAFWAGLIGIGIVCTGTVIGCTGWFFAERSKNHQNLEGKGITSLNESFSPEKQRKIRNTLIRRGLGRGIKVVPDSNATLDAWKIAHSNQETLIQEALMKNLPAAFRGAGIEVKVRVDRNHNVSFFIEPATTLLTLRGL